MVLMTLRCHSCVPWHMFSRATFIPLAANVCSIWGEHEVGPIVQMIFVLLVLRKPACLRPVSDTFCQDTLHTQLQGMQAVCDRAPGLKEGVSKKSKRGWAGFVRLQSSYV